MAKIDPEMLEHARLRRDEGWTLKRIGDELGKSEGTISRWLRLPDGPDLPEAMGIGARREALREQVIDKTYQTVFMALDRVQKDVKRGHYGQKHPPAVVLGILIDKVVALEAAVRNVPQLPEGTSVNIITEVNHLTTVFEKVANAGQPELPQGAVCEDDTPQPVYTEGPQAPSEAGGVPSCYRPEDG